MKWKKLGRIFKPDTNLWWQQYYGILPTPIHLPERKCIRVYFSTTCAERFGRITFMDVDESDPTKILYLSNQYILDVGDIGSFDDCGVISSQVIKINDLFYLYYAGYQRHCRVPFSILTGLAVSSDGVSFKKYSRTPILERTSEELNLRSAPYVICDNGVFKMWYSGSIKWEKISGKVHKDKLMPVYNLRYAESEDGINWQSKDDQMHFLTTENEFGFARPCLVKKEGRYRLFYSIRRRDISYRIGFADSVDGLKWTRKDQEIGIDVSTEGWDSEMICYPAVITVNNRAFLFYNGNNNGETGFGVAELVEEQ